MRYKRETDQQSEGTELELQIFESLLYKFIVGLKLCQGARLGMEITSREWIYLPSW